MDLEELIRSIDIVEYISQYIELEERNGEWWGLSPFKQEATPSFSVRSEPPFFYDFSSGKSGNLFIFIKDYFGLSNRETAEKIIEYAGLDEDQIKAMRKLDASITCKKYMKKSKIVKQKAEVKVPQNVMDKYENNPSKLELWRNEGISDESMKKFGVKYDPFANRIVYPIVDLSGKIVNVGGRALDKDWKERGESKYCYYYKWSSMNVIYGLHDNLESIRDKHEVILFEGCKSVLIADSWGIHNTAAILTSHLSPNQLKILAKLGCNVVFALDKDVKILEDKNIAKLKQYVNVSYIYDARNMIGDKDSPVDKGKNVFQKLYGERFRYR